MRKQLVLLTMFFGCCNHVGPAAIAAIFDFTIDPAHSFLTITPSTDVFGTPLTVTMQGPGSFTTSYSGVIRADVTDSTIQLLFGSSLNADSGGDWRPGTDYSNYPADLADPSGYAMTALPANYGLITDLSPLGTVLGTNGPSPSAIRYLAIALFDSAPKPLEAGSFNEAGTNTDFTSGTVYYGSGGSPPITDLANTVFPGPTDDSLGTATLTDAGGVQTLTIPVSFQSTYDVNFLTLTTRYKGVIVATAVLGDYNHNGTVDAADYVLYRATIGQTGSDLAADGNRNGSVDPGDLVVWRSHFGQTDGRENSIGSSFAAAPEPGGAVSVAIAGAILGIRRSFTSQSVRN